MLKAENRLKGQAEFSRILKEGKRVRGQFLTVVALPAATKASRVGIVVTKKVEKKAVGRNRLRRIVAHLFMHVLQSKESPFDAVVMVGRVPTKEIFKLLEEDVTLWQKKWPSS